MSNFKEDLAKVKAFVFDVDGVFSNSTVLLHPSGEMLRSMNIKDGYAVYYTLKKGYPICIISGGNSESVRTRFSATVLRSRLKSGLSELSRNMT